jgi:hypothetical protein
MAARRARGSTFAGFTAKVREKISAKPQDLSGLYQHNTFRHFIYLLLADILGLLTLICCILIPFQHSIDFDINNFLI